MATEAQRTAEETRKRLRDSIKLLSTPQQGRGGAAERVQAAKFLKGLPVDLLTSAAEEAGVSVDALPSLIEQYVPTPAPKVEYEPIPPNQRVPLSQRKIKQPSESAGEQQPQGKTARGSREFREGTAKRNPIRERMPVPSIEEVLQDLGGQVPSPQENQTREMQRPFATGANVAREFRRQMPRGSVGRNLQALEDSAGSPFPQQNVPLPAQEEAEIPRATPTGRKFKMGPGGKLAGTQEDFDAFLERQLASGNSQSQKLENARAAGREIGQRLNQENLSRYENFKANLGEPATELGRKRQTDQILQAEAEEYLTTMRRRIRGAEKTAREIARGYEQQQYGARASTDYGSGAPDFFAEVDRLTSVKAQLKGKDQKAQVRWARQQLDAREEERRRQEELEQERRRRVSQSSFQDLVTGRRATYLDKY